MVLEKAKELLDICYPNRYKLAVAESMTAGILADMICSVSGASKYFLGGIICYTSEIKGFVGVSMDMIERFGIYSQEVAAALAMGTVKRFGSDIGAGITGIAEPDGKNEMPGAWVGVTFLGKIETRHVLCEPGTPRNEARRHVAREALDLILEVVRRTRPEDTG